MIRFLISQLDDPRLIARYILSGLIAAAVQVGTLAVFVERVGMSHTRAVPIAFIISAIVAFCLQKFWTFGHRTVEGMHFQAVSYAILVVVALLLNVFFMRVFVDILGIWYILAQVITIALVTIVTFLSNKYLVFKHHTHTRS